MLEFSKNIPKTKPEMGRPPLAVWTAEIGPRLAIYRPAGCQEGARGIGCCEGDDWPLFSHRPLLFPLVSSTFPPPLPRPYDAARQRRSLAYNTNKLSRSFTAAPPSFPSPSAIMKSFAVLSLVATLAVAQSSSVCQLFRPNPTF